MPSSTMPTAPTARPVVRMVLPGALPVSTGPPTSASAPLPLPVPASDPDPAPVSVSPPVVPVVIFLSGGGGGGGGGGGVAFFGLHTSLSSVMVLPSCACSALACWIAFCASWPFGSASRYLQKYFKASYGSLACSYSLPMFDSSTAFGTMLNA